MPLLTHKPAQYRCLGGIGLAIAGRVLLTTPPTRENEACLRTKQVRLGHAPEIADEPPPAR